MPQYTTHTKDALSPFARRWRSEFWNIYKCFSRFLNLNVLYCVKWVPPPLHLIKINVDAAWNPSKASIAVVARDHRGFVLKAWSKHLDASDPMIAEATAIWWGLELAIQKGDLVENQ
uniref:RNase H type-1 domain-containing protein n=1 Tax=Fagus sylvatica TaxID=28930 RepID=A0A2N9F0C7_FAGSY